MPVSIIKIIHLAFRIYSTPYENICIIFFDPETFIKCNYSANSKSAKSAKENILLRSEICVVFANFSNASWCAACPQPKKEYCHKFLRNFHLFFKIYFSKNSLCVLCGE